MKEVSSVKLFFKKLFSYISRKPVDIGYGISTDSVTTIDSVPEPKIDPMVFYTINCDLGSFEIHKVVRKGKYTFLYYVYNSESDKHFWINKNLFEFLFNPNKTKHVTNFNKRKNSRK